MAKIIASLHVSLDGFIAGPKGEMDWIKFDDALFDFVGTMTQEASHAIYGRKTWQIMDSYWPEAGNQINASNHDKEHSTWYNQINKWVITSTPGLYASDKTHFITPTELESLNGIEGNMLLFGSGSIVRMLIQHQMLDEIILMMNPMALGEGQSLFGKEGLHKAAAILTSRSFSCGVTMLHYLLK